MTTLRIFVQDIVKIGVEKLQPVWTIVQAIPWPEDYIPSVVSVWTPSLARAPGSVSITNYPTTTGFCW